MSGKILKGREIEKKQGASGGAAKGEAEILPDTGGIIHRRVVDAGQEAHRIVAAAEAEAAHIRDEANRVLADAKATRQAEVRRGYAEGESKGLAQVTEKLIALERLRERFYAEAEPEVIRLVMSIAEKILGKLADEHPDMIKSVVKMALEKALGDRITVRLNPEDYKRVQEQEQEYRELADRTKRLAFREDEAIAKGGCIVETEVGTIDAMLSTQLAAIRKALMS
jgi:flagellar biosynthesis/type III secretory pathway protein FliH